MQKQIYRDLDLRFLAHPNTGDPIMLNDVDSIKQSIRLIVMLNQYEVPFNKYLYTNATYSLFENIDTADLTFLKNRIINAIQNNEPRAEIIDIRYEDRMDENYFALTIVFIPQNSVTTETVDVFLERVR
jgi:phage baseplate assembly protein W